MEELITIIILSMLSVDDLLKKKIRVYPCIFFILIGVLASIYREGSIGPWLPLAFLPGSIVVFISVVSRGRIGIGDGLCLMIMSLLLGSGRAIFAFFLSLILVGIIGEAFVLSRKIKKDAALPLVPFMFLGTVVSLVL